MIFGGNPMKQCKWIGTRCLTIVLSLAGGMAWAVPQDQAYRAGVGGVGYPKCSYCPSPKYPDEALKARYEGAVVLQAVITAKGRATKIIVVKNPGLGLDKKAIEVVKRWRFKPALGPSGSPVDVEVPIEVTFRLPTKKNSISGFGSGFLRGNTFR
jgi:TonB family protein